MNIQVLAGKVDRIENDLALARLAWQAGKMLTFRHHLMLACREYQSLESVHPRLWRRFENEVQSLCSEVTQAELAELES